MAGRTGPGRTGPGGRTGRLGTVAAAVAMAVTAVLAGAGVGSAAAAVTATATTTTVDAGAGAGARADTGAVSAVGSAPQDACGASAAAPVAAAPADPGPSAAAVAALAAGGGAAAVVSYRQAAQLPIGLWSAAAVTLRVPAGRGTVRLDLTSEGFSTDSMEVQRWVSSAHRWLDLTAASSTADFPTHDRFSFTLVTTAAVAKSRTRPAAQTVALRLQDLDRPGSLAVTASYTDAHGRTHRAPVRRSPVTRPQTHFTGWAAHTVLVRGGAARSLTMTVKNTTDRAYPSVAALFYAYGMGGGHALVPDDLVLQQYLAGTGWTRLRLVAGACDPGMSATPRPAAGVRLAPGATTTVRLRLAVAATAPTAVTRAEAGLSVQSGDTSLASASLPFTLRAAPAAPPAVPVAQGAHGQRR